MTRKDYNLLERVFKHSLNKFVSKELELKGESAQYVKKYHDFILSLLIEYIQEENPNFQPDRFMKE